MLRQQQIGQGISVPCPFRLNVMREGIEMDRTPGLEPIQPDRIRPERLADPWREPWREPWRAPWRIPLKASIEG
ncbi:hypothetical protein M0638_25840 [Roseomonas sp. NAR14]|uniref:Uncharacterized protein n=1 Tax=Roseomonas acroporae TaxID=2937791 RepID=A0A9X2BWG8_9PROT|nr:hypothetical protein [Roseomonas acroporae]MCK8787783.1 hypothetical protein [Roseomonas acroporae]